MTWILARGPKVPIIRIWPPFQLPEDESELEKTVYQARYYLYNSQLSIEFYVKQPSQSTSTVRKICLVMGDRIAQKEVTSPSNLPKAQYYVWWRVHKVKRLFLRPLDFLVDEKTGIHTINEWVRLVEKTSRNHTPGQGSEFTSPAQRINSCAILGTGPSMGAFAGEASQYDGWIGANGVVFYEDLWKKHPPYAVCMIDPYFFGPSSAFVCMRSQLTNMLRETNAILITALQFAPIVQHLFPKDILNKCRYVKCVGNDCYTASWGRPGKPLRIVQYGNVLTDLMLPIAASMSRKITLYGC